MMKRCFFIVISIFYNVYASETYIDGTIASVNNMTILYSDVKNIVMAMKYDEANSKAISEVDVLKDLIDQNIIISSDPNITLEREEQLIVDGVRKQANMIFEKYFNNNEEAFIQHIGCNLEDYIKTGITNQKKQILYNRVLDNMIKKNVVMHDEVSKFYDYLKSKNKLPTISENYNIYQIVLLQKHSEEVAKIVTMVQDELRTKKFDDVVKTISKYPGLKFKKDSSWHTLNDLNAEFESVVFGLTPGAISPPVRIDDFIYFIRLDALDKDRYKTSMLYICDNMYKLTPQEAFDDLNKIRKDIVSGKLTWVEAVRRFSQDTKKNLYGQVFNDKGSIDLKKTDVSLAVRQALKKTPKKTVSAPFVDDDKGEKAFKIIYVNDYVEQHTACIERDYAFLEGLTNEQCKKAQKYKILLKLYKEADIKLNAEHPLCIKLKEKYKDLFK
ncbi:MAG: peptidylprolyl isomerase [Cytophagales bacterium]|nr:peptidylprolyl isomerase [Cytophagales bacterium]